MPAKKKFKQICQSSTLMPENLAPAMTFKLRVQCWNASRLFIKRLMITAYATLPFWCDKGLHFNRLSMTPSLRRSEGTGSFCIVR